MKLLLNSFHEGRATEDKKHCRNFKLSNFSTKVPILRLEPTYYLPSNHTKSQPSMAVDKNGRSQLAAVPLNDVAVSLLIFAFILHVVS